MDSQLTYKAQQDEKEVLSERSYADTLNDGDDDSITADFSDKEVSMTDADEKPWKNSENAKNAQRRRDAEQKRAIREAREAAIIEALGGKNPFTGEEIRDSKDIDEYLLMKDIDNRGGDPVYDFAKYHKEKQKREEEIREKDAEQQRWIAQDKENFSKRYPDVDIGELIGDEGFRLYADGKTGNMPLADIYDGYMSIVSRFDSRVKQTAAKLYANHKASPGALSSFDMGRGGYFTPEQVRAMSPEEVRENYDRIRVSMTKWK